MVSVARRLLPATRAASELTVLSLRRQIPEQSRSFALAGAQLAIQVLRQRQPQEDAAAPPRPRQHQRGQALDCLARPPLQCLAGRAGRTPSVLLLP